MINTKESKNRPSNPRFCYDVRFAVAHDEFVAAGAPGWHVCFIAGVYVV